MLTNRCLFEILAPIVVTYRVGQVEGLPIGVVVVAHVAYAAEGVVVHQQGLFVL